MIKTNQIRTVDELERLRVTISEEIEQLLQTGKDTKTLDRIKALRQEQGAVKDELALAKNIEKSRAKEALIAEIRSTEAKTREQYERMLSLANQILPKIKEIEPMLNALSSANLKRVQFNAQLDGSLERYRSTYEELLEVKQPKVAVAQMVDVANLRDCIIRLLHQWEAQGGNSPTSTTIENKAPQGGSGE